MRFAPLLSLSLLACAAPGNDAAGGPVARNVVIVITDDQGFGDFGFQGSEQIRTPHLDRLAEESAQMATFYVSPVCAPTRAALMTGRWPQRARVIDTYIGRAMLPPEEVTLAELLDDAGFATGIFGKWHLGDCFPMRPQDQGFDHALVHRGGGIGQPSDPEGGEGRYTDPILFENGARVEPEGYCTDIYFDEALEWMGARHAAGERFFTYIATNAPHGPFHDVPKALYEDQLARGATDKDARIFAMIENIDENIGKLSAGLEAMGAADDTLVLFLVDNGPNTRRYVRELRGMKSEVHDGGVRSPLLARWPQGFPAGMASDRISAHVDLAPTVLEACGVEPADAPAFDGRSLAPLLAHRDVAWPDRTLVIQAHRGDAPVRWHNALVRNQDWKLVNASGFGKEVGSVEPKFELYAGPDHGEVADVAEAHPEVVAELAAAYEAWFLDVGADRPERYEPTPIVLGDSRAPEVHLTRQDWRRMESGGWGAQGVWHVDVIDPGPYTVELRFLNGTTPEQATLRVGEETWTAPVEPGSDRQVFTALTLPLGRAGLITELEQGEGEAGAYQVRVRSSETAAGRASR